jgi:DNA mismatch endonuclease (patch repair protein)
MSRKTQSPSFRGLLPSSVHASRVAKANKKKDTLPEKLLRSALSRRGTRYRLHDLRLPGVPDLILPGARTVVFVDGDFWHGRRWGERRKRLLLGANATYWVPKIERNRARDRANARRLRRLGWTVVRVWESEVRSDADQVAREILSRAGLAEVPAL